MEAWLEFEGGRRACFYASNGYVSDAPVILEIEGDKGCVMMHGPEILLRSKDAQSGVEKTKVLQVEQKEGIGKGYWGSGHLACIRDFYLCLDEKKSFSGNLEGVENTFRTMMEIYGVHARSGSGEAGI